MSRHVIAAFVSLAAMTACSSGTSTTDSTSEQQQALTEAAASAEDAKVTADACFAAFESCKTADGADLAACKATLKECLPAEAHPGPHCGPPRGKGKGSPHGPNGDCDGGAGERDGGPAHEHPAPDGDDDGDADGGRPKGGPGGGGHGGGGGKEPGFCKKVPLPSSPEVQACRDALDACITAGSDHKTCFDAEHACVKAAFDAAAAAAAAATN